MILKFAYLDKYAKGGFYSELPPNCLRYASELPPITTL